MLVYPAMDLHGQWIFHCLDLDIISQGSTPSHAFEMGLEAVRVTLTSNETKNLERAPKEYWALLRIILMRGRLFAILDKTSANRVEPKAFATYTGLESKVTTWAAIP